MFVDLCTLLDRHQIPYAILAGYEQYPEHIPSDVDFMVSAADFERLPALFGQPDCLPGAALVQVLLHQPTSRYFVFARQVGSRLAFLHPDA
ncbi:MAG: hypothetical protein OEU93_07945, partial [Rubrivivax sp.]|nr:hypothetical protein [Rubrivivax sp.]